MKPYTRICDTCNAALEETSSRATVCLACSKAKQVSDRRQEQKALLEQHYSDVEFAGLNAYGKAQWTLTHQCGERQTMLMNNINTMMKKYGKAPCKKCK
jgi:hypothetical protein